MSKKGKSKKTKKKIEKKPSVSQENNIGQFFIKHKNILPLTILLILLIILFHEMMFSSKTLLPPDSLTSKSNQPFINDALDRGIYPKWNPFIFSGLPLFASLTGAKFVDIIGDIINSFVWIVQRVFPLPDFTIMLLNFFLFGIFIYILLMKKTNVRLIALFAAIAIVFQPPIIAFAAFGHSTKLTTALLIPIIFLLVEELLEKRNLLNFALLALAVGLQMLRAHTQISYYTFMFIGLFVVYWIIESFVRKRNKIDVAKSVGFLTGALAIGVAMSSWIYFSVQEYAQYSIRGGGTGLDYNYATSWSFSPLEVLTFFVPSFLGFGGPTYWGNMPFTDYPLYMGIIPLFFAGLAFVIRRERTVWFLGLVIILSLFISFGKEFSILYDMLFKYLPYFNKFRVPTMILILVQFSVVVLSSLALYSLWQLGEKDIAESMIKRIKKYIYAFGAVVGLIFLYLLVAKDAMFSRMMESANYQGNISRYGSEQTQTFQEQSYSMAMNDSVLMLILLALTVILLLVFLKQKIKANHFLSAVITLTVINLWIVDFKIINPNPKANEEAFFRADETVNFLKADTTLYRILPVLDNRPDNWYTYHFIQNAFGYHPAKLKIYQETLEAAGFPTDTRNFLLKYYKPVIQDGRQGMAVRTANEMDQQQWRFHENLLRMLNVKYIITPHTFPDSSYKMVRNTRDKNVFEHIAVLPRAFFVDQIKKVSGKEVIFSSLRSSDFDPARTALIYNEIPNQIGSSEGNKVVVTGWDIHKLELQVTANQSSFLVVSEPYYPAGWQAKLNDIPLEIYQTNHILRGVFVPQGEHTVLFEFKPKRFWLGFFITAFLLVGCIVMVIFAYNRQK